MIQILIVSIVLLWLVVVFNLLLTFAAVRKLNARLNPRKGLDKGKRAPAFSAQTLDGEHVTLAHYAGRIVALLFISASCSICRKAIPEYTKLAQAAALSGISLVLVSGDEVAETRAFAKELNIQLPILMAPTSNNTFLKEYRCSSVPFYYIVDEQGKIQSSGNPTQVGGEWEKLSASWQDDAAKQLV